MTSDTPGRRISHHTYTPGSWAGGSTRGIWASPAAAIGSPAAAALWVGTAAIARDAPYSHFPNQERLQILLDGAGLRLHFRAPAEVVTLGRLGQHRFDGARPVEAELSAGPVVAFNLVYHRGSTAEAQVLAVGPDPLVWAARPASSHPIPERERVRLVYVIAGSLAIHRSTHQPIVLDANDTFVVEPAGRSDHLAPLHLAATASVGAEVVLAVIEGLP